MAIASSAIRPRAGKMRSVLPEKEFNGHDEPAAGSERKIGKAAWSGKRQASKRPAAKDGVVGRS